MQNSGKKIVNVNHKRSYSRPCDSHNLNTSPLCDLASSTQPMKWGKEVAGEYEDTDAPEYIQSLVSPMRNTYYTQTMRDQEMLKTFTKVSTCTIMYIEHD